MRNLLDSPITDGEIIQCLEHLIEECDPECVGDMRPSLLKAAIKRVRDYPAAPSPYMDNLIVGRVSGEIRQGNQVPGMPDAICHACGLGYKCLNEDCPNDPAPTVDKALEAREILTAYVDEHFGPKTNG